MRNILITLLLFVSLDIYSQKVNIDSLKSRFDDYQSKVNTINDIIEKNEKDISGLKKIKISGYIQGQWDFYDKSPNVVPNNTFFLKNAVIKTIYKATDGVKFVLQPSFIPGTLLIKEAYAVLNDPWLNIFSLSVGQFYRLNYEVELSSSTIEVPERSRIIKAIYPKESEVGAKLDIKYKNIPLAFEFAIINGNYLTGLEQKDNDNSKDLMSRLVYTLKLPNQKLGIDLGVHSYYGSVKTNVSKYILNSDNSLDSVNNIGDVLYKKWIGAEARVYWDFLGGIALKAEYIVGQNAFLGTSTNSSTLSGGTTPIYTNGTITTTGQTSATKTVITPNKVRSFSGYYLYLIKNINKKNQFVVKYDNYDPNTKLSGDKADKSNMYYNTVTLAWQHYFDDNIKITLGYEMPFNEHNSTTQDILDNTFTFRIQAKF